RPRPVGRAAPDLRARGRDRGLQAARVLVGRSGFRRRLGPGLTAQLTHFEGRKLDKFDLPDQAAAEAARTAVESGAPFNVVAVEKRRVKRHPMPPFTTSTLQQEASRKLGFGASRTMRLAQQLYE